MVQSRPAASRRNVAPGASTAPPPEKTVRVSNAKGLRKAYVELQQAPDGVDLDPMTMPKCVECSHCGWPVYPRESKVATKKTFARAGIVRGTRKEEETKRRENGPGDPDADAGSEDSRDTVEKMADEVEDLKDKVEMLENENRELNDKVDDLTKELEAVKAELEEAKEKIDFLEEAELRWREKLSQARMEIERLKNAYERASMVSADRETGYIKTFLELRALKVKHEAFVRRRNFMLVVLEKRFEQKELEDTKAATTRLWRTRAIWDKLKAQLQDAEVRRQKEVRQLGWQLAAEKEHVIGLKLGKEKLKEKLKQAGQRLLRRTMGTDHWPGLLDHAFRAIAPGGKIILLEENLAKVKEELEKVKVELQEMTEIKEALVIERDDLVELRDKLQEEIENLGEANADSLALVEKRKSEAREVARLHELELEKLREKLEEQKVESEAQVEVLEAQIKLLESRLQATKAEMGKYIVDEGERIVPKGEGVMCLMCLKQLVHRTVKPLKPVEILNNPEAKMEKGRQKFYETEMQGLMNPKDEMHTYAFNSRKDPYGISRLTLYPGSAITKPTSPSSPNLSSPGSPTTGLPALKKRRDFGGSATSLRATMKECYKPRAFR